MVPHLRVWRGARLGLRWARWTSRRRVAILVASGLCFVAALPIAARLPLQGDLPHLLPPHTRSVEDLHRLEARAQAFGTIVVAIESDDPQARARAAELVRARLAARSPGVIASVAFDRGARDRYAWENRFLLAPPDELEAVRDELAARKQRLNPLYVSLDEPAARREGHGDAFGERLKRLQAQLARAQAGAAHPQPLVSDDGKLQLVIVRTHDAAGDVSRNAGALRAVEEAAAEAHRSVGPSVRIGLGGDVPTTASEHRALLGGMLRATVFTVVLVAAGMWLFFGSAAPVGALLAALGLGAVVTFAFARLCIGHLNLATAFLAPIVVGNGINFGIILLGRYLEERRRTLDREAALGAAIHGSVPGTLAAALTAAGAYGSLLATDFLGFRHFGILGGVGILLCWLATYLVLPAALACLEARGLVGGRAPMHLPARAASWLTRAPRAGAAIAIIVLLAGGLGAARFLASRPYETDFKNLRSSGADTQQIRDRNARVDRAFGRGLSGGIAIALPSRARAREVGARLRAADRDKAAGARLFTRVASLDDLVPPDQDQRLALLGELRALLTDKMLALMSDAERDTARALRPPANVARLTDEGVPAELAWSFTEQDGARGKLLWATPGPGFDLWRTEDLERFVSAFGALELGDDLVVGGNAFVQRDIVRSLDRDGPRATLVAALGALVVVVLILGVTRQAAVTLFCAACGVGLLLTAAHVLHLRINFLDFVSLPITIGIGIDYAVNLTARHRAEGPGSTARILTTTAPAVALCSFTTVVGYASLLFSANQGIRSFGLASLIGELTCIAAALALAPALLEWRRRAPAPDVALEQDEPSQRLAA